MSLFMKKILFVIVAILVAAASFALETKNTKGELSVKLNININGKTDLKATLFDNSSSVALVELLEKGAVTIDMHDFSNFEKVGDLPVMLPRNDSPTDTDSGDLILYLGKRFVIYYDKNSWDFTRLGKVDGVTKAELKSILGKGNVKAVLSLAK